MLLLKSCFNQEVDSTVKYFLVCGLGNLGQHCVQVLEKFGVPIIAIDGKENKDIVWEVDDISHSLKKNVIVGDCRKENILVKAKIKQCRVVLLVTNDEQVNIEAAFKIRELNSEVRLVVRSAQQNINEKLKPILENIVAYDANKLPVEAIATRALGDENRGFIPLGEDLLEVIKDKIDSRHKWCDWQLRKVNKKCRVLSHKQAGETQPTDFHQWKHNAILHPGDEVAYIKVNKGSSRSFVEGQRTDNQRKKRKKFPFKIQLSGNWKKLSQEIHAFLEWSWESAPQQFSKRLILLIFLIWAILLLFGTTFLSRINAENHNWHIFDFFYCTFVMLLGTCRDVCPGSTQKDIHMWMQVMNLVYVSAGLFFIGIVNAWLTQWWLNEKFELSLANPIPKKDHIVIVGLGRQISRPVAMFLHNELKQSVVAVSRPLENSKIVTQRNSSR